jgi:hypothetical protein
MNLKKLTVGAAIAASVVGGSVVASAPAHAGDLIFGGSARIKNSGVAVNGTSALDFAGFNGGPNSLTLGTGTGTVLTGSDPVFGAGPLTLKDFLLTKTSLTTWSLQGGPIVNFIQGLAGGATYTLNSFSLTKLAPAVFNADYTGVFSNLPGGIGTLTSTGDLTLANGAGFSSAVDGPAVVPTPALLPALLGMGAAALRKRKGEAAEPETVKA